MKSNVRRENRSRPCISATQMGLLYALLALGLISAGCTESGPSDSPTVDSNSNWLSVCVEDSDCAAGTSCLCGVCTVTCTSGACEDNRAGRCLSAGTSEQDALCLSGTIDDGICLPECSSESECGAGFTCIDETCQPLVDTREALCRDDSRCADDRRCIEACEGSQGDTECQVTCRPGSECVEDACQPLSCDAGIPFYCAEDLGLAGEVLFECVEGQLMFSIECAGECSTHERRAGCADVCPAGSGTYCGQRGENPDTLFSCHEGVFTPQERCGSGCTGVDGSAECAREN